MKDDICTIPISEIFEKQCGCPFCAIHKSAEEKALTYIMGAAMMEPDVRIMTNQLGFCGHHYSLMNKRSERLSIGLILKSRLDEIENNIKKKKPSKNESNIYPHARVNNTCFICDKIEWGISRMYSIVYLTYAKERDFRELFAKQEYICYTHYEFLFNNAKKNILKKEYNEFLNTSTKLTLQKTTAIKENIDDFCNLFDYQKSDNFDEDRKDKAKQSIEQAYEFDSDYSIN